MLVSHVWPGITPMNVWDMTYREWRGFAKAADDYAAEMRKVRK